MPTVKGREAVARYTSSARALLANNVLPGAARAGAAVVTEEIKRRANADLVRENLVTKLRKADGRITVRISVKPGFAQSLAIWQEYSTSPHFIRVDDEQGEGRTAGRINRLDKAAAKDGRIGPGASLVIGGNFVGGTVFHPGARAEPFFRTSLDVKEGEAIAAAQSYINARVVSMRQGGLADSGDADE